MNRSDFRGFRAGGYLFARVGKADADPIKVKTFDSPRPAAQLLATAMVGHYSAVSALMQSGSGTTEVQVWAAEGGWTKEGLELLRALASDDEIKLAEALGLKGNDEPGPD
jgi:hypothetical protein